MKRFAALVLLMGVLGGCALTAQQVNLSPTLSVLSSVEGKSVIVAVQVVDERPSKTLGRLVGDNGATMDVTSSQDVAVVVEKCLSDGLKKKGFNPVNVQEGDFPRLLVEVNLLEYTAFKGLPMGRAIIKGAIKATATRGKAAFESAYRTEREEKVLGMPSADKTEKWINSVLGDVVSQLLSDTNLLKFLVS